MTHDRKHVSPAMWSIGFSAILAISALLNGLWSVEARGEDQFPSRMVRIIVAYPPGGQIDIVARLVANGLAKEWGQTVIVENIQGAGGIIGSAAAFRANPDGYTLLVTSPSFVTNEFTNKNSNWTLSQWSPVALLATTPYLLVSRKGLDVATPSDVVTLARQKPNAISYASNGIGSSAHLSAVQMQILSGVQMLHVPYRGAAAALNDIVAERVDIYFDALTTTLPAWHDNKIKALGVTSPSRSHFVPEIPTLAEAGVPNFESMSWVGLIAPPSTPSTIVDNINKSVRKLLREKATSELLNTLNMDVVATSPAETTEYLAAERTRWGNIITKSGISFD